MYDFTLLPYSVHVRLNNKSHIIGDSHPNFSKLIQALKDGVEDDVIETLLDIGATLAKFSTGLLTVHENEISYNGEKLGGSCVEFILSLLAQGFDITRYAKFLEDLQKNPSMRAREQLWDFVNKWGLFLNPDGRMVLRKAVRANFTDNHTGTFNNSPGTIVTMTRKSVDDDPTRLCSKGLHVCHPEYLKSFHGDKYVEVFVWPRHVVAIPLDYDLTKFRVEEYYVNRELTLEEAKDYQSLVDHEVDEYNPFTDDYSEVEEYDYDDEYPY